jgi:type I restriction-modification system DNA methylase subunit
MRENLFISNATKNNWEKLNLSEEEKLGKLSKRANKQNSQKNIIPIEYFKNKRNIELVTNILNYVNKKNLPIEDVIYNLAMNILSKNEFVEIVLNRVYTGNLYISEIIEQYGVYYLDETLLKYNLPFDEPDILGIIYQSLLKEGKKNAKGSYYTPRNIVEKIVQKSKPNDIILDPCCGTGSFLLEFATSLKPPKFR